MSLSDRPTYTRTRVCTHVPPTIQRTHAHTHTHTHTHLPRVGTVTFEQWVAVMLETAESEVKEKKFFGLF